MGEDKKEEITTSEQVNEDNLNEYNEDKNNNSEEYDETQYNNEDYQNSVKYVNSNTKKTEYTYVDEDGNEVECVQYEVVQTVNNIWSILATIFGISSLILWIIPIFGFIISIIGIILSAISFKYTRSPLYSRTSKSKIAITMSIIGFFLALAFSILKVILFIM